MKKVLAAALICTASSAFATWDMFPPSEAGKGEAKVGFEYDIPGEKTSVMGVNLGARYSIIEGFEASLMLGGPGFVLSKSFDGKSADDASGLNKPVIGLRYWLPLGLGIAVDAALPLGGENVVGKEPQFGLDAGLQFSAKFTEEFVLGAEALATIINKADKDNSNGIELNAAVEADYSIGALTSWLSFDLTKGLTKPDGADDTDPLGIGFSIGVIYDITESIYAQAGYWMGLAGDAYKDYKPKSIEVDFGIKF